MRRYRRTNHRWGTRRRRSEDKSDAVLRRWRPELVQRIVINSVWGPKLGRRRALFDLFVLQCIKMLTPSLLRLHFFAATSASSASERCTARGGGLISIPPPPLQPFLRDGLCHSTQLFLFRPHVDTPSHGLSAPKVQVYHFTPRHHGPLQSANTSRPPRPSGRRR